MKGSPEEVKVPKPKFSMKNSTKSDIGVLKTAALGLFTGKFAMAVEQERMSMDLKD